MAPIRMDLSKAGTGEFDLVPNGDYPAHVFEIKQDVTKGGKAPGTPMLKVRYKLDGGKGSVFDNIVLNEASAWKFKQLCVAAGIPADRLGADAEVEIAELQGAPVVVTVGTRPEEGQYKAQNVVQKVVSADAYEATASPSGGASWDD